MKHKKEYIEEQKGPIRMDAQYTQKFDRSPMRVMQDIINNEMRQDKMTMTLHEPKR
jgi:hypothetical protein